MRKEGAAPSPLQTLHSGSEMSSQEEEGGEFFFSVVFFLNFFFPKHTFLYRNTQYMKAQMPEKICSFKLIKVFSLFFSSLFVHEQRDG